jgi:hypothetical protein
MLKLPTRLNDGRWYACSPPPPHAVHDHCNCMYSVSMWLCNILAPVRSHFNWWHCGLVLYWNYRMIEVCSVPTVHPISHCRWLTMLGRAVCRVCWWKAKQYSLTRDKRVGPRWLGWSGCNALTQASCWGTGSEYDYNERSDHLYICLK